MAAVWSVRFKEDGPTYSFDDFPPGVFQRVANRHEMGWFPLFYQPAENTDAFLDLLGEMADHVGAERPTATTMSEFHALMRSLEPGIPEDDEDEPEIPMLQTPTEPEVPEEESVEEEVPEEDVEEAE